ncbi:hypothetical protein JF544_13145 [Halobacillus kuroshimensis]|uniref:Uncharacterized protein n=1 Tax=Halobacillus kuroshimensis TaxID=302481 RepID=A0ABS3DXX0_9BACI|nr:MULTISPECIES: hypothetical protein [Halobacillus]MBN8236205.1 hypothetical protein [Halobacillus kuroshimensis]
MNKATLIVFLVLCLLFLTRGLYIGVSHGEWTSLIIALLIIAFGSYRLYKKNQK